MAQSTPLSQKLVQLGFSKNQATVYEALIELGQSKASAIIKRTGMHRNIVYEALDELVHRKLAFKTSKGGVAFFQLSDASTIVTDAQKQLQTAEEISNEINSLRQKASHETKMYEGMSGLDTYIQHIYRELKADIDDGKKAEFLILGTDPKSNQDLFDNFWQKKNEQRAKLGIPSRLLFEQQSSKYAEEANKIDLLDARLLPPSIQDPTIAYIWKNTVAFVLYEMEPFVISIENKKLADSFRDYFEQLWNQDTQIYRGEEAVIQLMEQSLKYKDNWFIGGNGGMERVMPKYWKEYNKKRIEKGVWWHDLVDRDMYLSGVQQTAPGVPDEERLYEYKWLPEDVSSPSVIFLFGNTVANIIWEAEGGPIAFTVQNDDVFNGYKKYFNFLWNQEITMTTGLEAVQKLFYEKMRALEPGDKYKVYGATYGEESFEEMHGWFIDYHKERLKNDIEVELLAIPKYYEQVVQEMKNSGDTEMKLTTVKPMSANSSSPMQFNIYEDSVTMYHFAPGEEAMAIDIRKPAISAAMNQYFEAEWSRDMWMHTGLEGAEQVQLRIMRSMKAGDTYYVNGGQYGSKNPEYQFEFYKRFHKERVERGINIQLIGLEKHRDWLIEEMRQADPEFKQTELRFLTNEFAVPVFSHIYPNTVITGIWDYDEAMITETTSPDAHSTMKKHFDRLWEIASE